MSRRLMQAKALDDTIFAGFGMLVVFCLTSLFLGSVVTYLMGSLG